MSLDYDLTGIADYELVCWQGEPGTDDRSMNPVTHGLIFMTMAIGIGEITEQNAEEFYTRTYAWESVYGSMVTGAEGEELRMTPADVRAHVGLRTNVFPKRTDAAFRKQLTGHLADRAQYSWRKATEPVTVQ